MNPTIRPRFVVREKASKTGRGTWAVCDRRTRKVDSRYCYRASAEQVAQSLNDIERDRLAGTPWPAETYSDRWTCITPEIAPGEAEAIEEPTAQDRADWARMSNDDDAQDDAHDVMLVELSGPMLDAYHDRLEAEFFARVPDQELAEFGVIARR